jgi:catechol 2,3-dioxygenase-like lactoylglutathione lyase family enzyme
MNEINQKPETKQHFIIRNYIMKKTLITLLASILILGLSGMATAKPPVPAKFLLFAYVVPDYDETAKFYKEILDIDFPAETFSVNKLEVEKGGIQQNSTSGLVELLQIEKFQGMTPGYGSGHLGFIVDDIEAMHTWIASKGLNPSEIMFPLEGNQAVRIFFFRGPNQEKIEIVEIRNTEK